MDKNVNFGIVCKAQSDEISGHASFDSNDFRDLEWAFGHIVLKTEIPASRNWFFFLKYIEAKEVQFSSQKKVKAMTDDLMWCTHPSLVNNQLLLLAEGVWSNVSKHFKNRLIEENELSPQCLKITEKSHFTLQAKRATFTFWVDKSSLKMPKIVQGNF